MSLWPTDTGAAVVETFLPPRVRVSKRFWSSFWLRGGFRVSQAWSRCNSAVTILEAGSVQKLGEICSLSVQQPKREESKEKSSIKFDLQPLVERSNLDCISLKLASFLKRQLHLKGIFAVVSEGNDYELATSSRKDDSVMRLSGITVPELISSTPAEQRSFFRALNSRSPNGCEGVIWVTEGSLNYFKANVWGDPSYARPVDFSRSSLSLELGIRKKENHTGELEIQLELIDYFRCLHDGPLDP